MYGQWVGELKVEGNHMTDCDKPENARELHQLRDLLVRVEIRSAAESGWATPRRSRLARSPSAA